MSGSPLRIGWFATGTGETSPKLLAAVLGAIHSEYLHAEISVVFCNREPGEDPASDRFQSTVQEAGLPLVSLSDRRFRRERGGEPARKGHPLPAWRGEYDREVVRLLRPYPFDVGMLAGYKLIFGAAATSEWDLLNLHPAVPGGPKGVWQEVIWQIIDSRADRAGVMVHLATPELDEGPPITYCTYSIRGRGFDELWSNFEGLSIDEAKATDGERQPLFQAIRTSGVDRKIPLVVETLRVFADGRVHIRGKRVVSADGEEIAAVDLSSEIEAHLARET